MDKQYRDQDFVDNVDKIANELITEKRSNHHRDKFFPLMIERLGYKTGAEIGVDKGAFSHHLLSKTNLERLYCIDCWMDDFGSDHKPEEYDPVGDNRMQTAMKLLGEFGERAQFMKATSAIASQSIPNDSLDFCYIDGDHSLEGIYTDVYSWIHKVRIGGMLAGHDYKDGPKSGIKDYWGGQLPYLIKSVVDNFGLQYGYKVHEVGGRIMSWYFVKT